MLKVEETQPVEFSSALLAKFDEIVAFAGVDDFIDTPVKRYSSGMYVRLAFAVAAHLEPDILIVDEVLAVGDADFQKKCLGKINDVSRGGRTVLFVSHNMAAVQALEFYAAALGLTQERDGYVFEPVPGETAKFICRGQVIPDADHEITYEVFIDEVIEGETPKVFAALLARSDDEAEAMVRDALADWRDPRAPQLLERLTQAWLQGNLKDLEAYATWCDCVNTPSEREASPPVSSPAARSWPVESRIVTSSTSSPGTEEATN